MQTIRFDEVNDEGLLACDLLIVGGGAAGLTIAREFFGTGVRVLVVESGDLAERPETDRLNAVDVAADVWSPAQVERRRAFHGSLTSSWSHEGQSFGVRCRVLGGSTHAWAGKSAAFDEIDMRPRPWVAQSGWPIQRAELDGVLDRAARHLNLGPNCYDDSLWDVARRKPPEPRPDPRVLRSFFWQFARSRIDPLDLLRMGPEFQREQADNIRVLLGATVTAIRLKDDATTFDFVEVASLSGKRGKVRAQTCVLAASAIENARLLLASRTEQRNGIGNAHDTVGRFLTDHPSLVIGHFAREHVATMNRTFGFIGVPKDHTLTMYMRGLAPTDAVQEREKMLNCAVFMMSERAPDDPWDAMKRLLRGRSKSVLADVTAIATSPKLVAMGVGRKLFQSRHFPGAIRTAMVNLLIRFNPNFVVEEFQTGGIPHKLVGMSVQAICEQPPERHNRVGLSDRLDPLGVPMPRVDWSVSDDVARSIARLGLMMRDEFASVGLPPLVLDDWIVKGEFAKATFIDMAHTAGTTRMARDPREGVVDENCKVFGTEGLFVAGASVFPTSGHANPTLMIVSLAIRLADHLKHVASRAPEKTVRSAVPLSTV
jgi:choline dehydrogenase-like flavoprotein